MRKRHRWRRALALTTTIMLLGGTAAANPPFVENDAEAIYTLTGSSAGDYFGWVAADIGDLDGDGVTEIVIPAITESSGGTIAGRVYVYSGATGTQIAVHDGTAFELFGYSTSAAGDVDGDGLPDYIVGAPGYRFAPTPPLGRVVVYSGADHSVIHEVVPAAPSAFGGAVSGAGDLDGDGHDDFIVGAMLDDEERGTVTAYSGADATVLWTATGTHAAHDGHSGDLFGSAAGLVGDVNGDAVPDVSIGAFGANGGRGNAYVLSGVDGSIIHVLKPFGDGDVFGQFFASGAGDIDADGINDVFVADYNAGRGPRVGSGAAYVFSGATGRRLLALHAEEAGDGFGPGRGVGDINGDGHGDLIIAAYTSSAGASEAGKASVISGVDGSVLRTITSTIAGENFGVDALALGDLDGDGLTDYLVTAVGLAFAGTDPGTVYVIKGTDLAH
jgi:hypothetical protein